MNTGFEATRLLPVATARKQAPAAKRAKRVSGEDELGQRLRAYREARRLSLRELARRLGISPSAVSQIETGKSRPSVSTLYAIVTELGISLDELFSGTNDATPRAAQSVPDAAGAEKRDVQRSGRRKTIELETGVRWERLTPHADPDADFLYVVYDVGGSSCQEDRLIRHAGREYGLVLSGTLEVTVGFETQVLGPGDSICFDSTQPHCLRNAGEEPVHGVWFVVGRHDDHRRIGLEHAGAGPAREVA